MKQRLPILLALLLGFWAFSAMAQDAPAPNPSVYKIGGVDIDVTAASAAKARDQAIADAQRTAFNRLLERLGVDASVGGKLSNDDLSTLVQNFEVRNDRTSAVRYIGTFAVQFRPIAVRNFLGSRHASFNDTQARPVLILPVSKTDHAILWEEPTLWQKAWGDAARDAGMVPVLLPTGGADDAAIISADDAVKGKIAPIKALAAKYQCDKAVVVVLNGAPDNPAAGFTVDMQDFGQDYDDGSDVTHIILGGNPDKSAVEGILAEGVKDVRQQLEKDWKISSHKASDSAAGGTPQPQSWSNEEPPARLPVTVQITTLAEWADIQRRLMSTAGVKRIDVSSLGRGGAEIELGFAGTPEALQVALAQHNLRLSQDVLSGAWVLKGF